LTSGNHERDLSKYLHYGLVISVLIGLGSSIALLNGYFRMIDVSPYVAKEKLALRFLSATGYVGMFFIYDFSTIPVYVLVPFYGYLCYLGYYNLRLTFLVMTASAIFLDELEYFSGRFVGRSILLRVLSLFGIQEKQLDQAENWIATHGPFSIFMSTFFLELGDVASLAAGILKMNFVQYTIASFAGDSLETALLLYIGFVGVNVLNSSLDYSFRFWLFLALAFSMAYLLIYIAKLRCLL